MNTLSFLVLALIFHQSFGQFGNGSTTNIQGIRLRNSNVYGNQGRVEILYNNTWGTICDTYWGLPDGRVACRMLGYSDVVCTTSNALSGRADSEVPIWMSRLLCRGTETYLDNCPYNGWGSGTHSCSSHSDDAGVVCRDESILKIPEVRVENTTTRTISISWPANFTIPTGVNNYRFVVQYNSTISFTPILQYVSINRYAISTRYYANIINLVRDREYSISVRFEVSFSVCSRYYYSYTYMSGSYSDPITVRTNDTARESIFDVRLISPISGLQFLGRVEVLYNNIWGTVCDYSFDYNAANVICHMLNYTRAACSAGNAQFGRGSGTIWLNRVRCSGAEILDDCSYRFRSSYSTYCRSYHSDDVGVVCVPEPEDFLPAPNGFNITNNQTTSVTFSWKRYNFPSYLRSKRLRLEYTRSDVSYISSRILSYYSTSYTLTRLPLGITIDATIRAQGRFTNYGCYTYLDGQSSDNESITLMERPPSGPPQSFFISVVNCSAIRAEWALPRYDQRNGIVRGYKLMILPSNGIEMVINLAENETEYIIGGLEASMRYVVSVLAYTIGDGPRSIHLTVTTNPQDICQTDIIDIFGVNGNGIDKIILYSSSYYYGRMGISILCGSNLPGVDINWFFSNGTNIGIGNRDIYEGDFSNGTSALLFRRRTLCVGGLYICRANQTSTGRMQQRTLKVTVDRNPPTPGRPIMQNVTSTTATISWSMIPCYGGHDLQYYTIKIGYRYRRSYYSSLAYYYINSIDARLMNYTIMGLTSNTNYQISVRAEGQDSTYSSYSNAITITTLPPVPTPPHNVAVVLIAPDTILVTWTRPSVPSGRIVYYTVYATPFIGETIFIPRTKRQVESFQTIAKNFSSSASSGNLTLPQQGVEYHVQVSVTVFDSVSGTNRESLFSAVNPNATLFVPIEGLPFPSRVFISSSSNVSLTVVWDAPTITGYTINGYLVKYSAMVEGRSPLGNLISFVHEGSSTTTGNVNQITVQPLIPQTNYLLKVAALTNKGEGMQVRVNGYTNKAASEFERFVYFHFRFGPVLSCTGFRKNLEGQESTVKEQILKSLNDMCYCGLTDANIGTGFFSCGKQDHQIIYRAHILGTSFYSAIDLVDLFQSWVRSGRGYVRINSFSLQLDPTCRSRLDTLDDPECDDYVVTTSMPTKTDKPSIRIPFVDRITAGSVTGIVVGVVIAVLLVVVVIMLGIGFYYWKIKGPQRNTTTESITPFSDFDGAQKSDLSSLSESNLYDSIANKMMKD